MKKYVLDTNCFINAVNPNSPSYDSVRRILNFAKNGFISVSVSLHSLHQLEEKKDKAWELAKSFPQVDHWPIGAWDEQVAAWKQVSGTWNDARHNDQIQQELNQLAKSGTDIRDRGAFIDALCSNYDGFITSDKQFVASGPARRINQRFPIKVISPEDLVKEIGV